MVGYNRVEVHRCDIRLSRTAAEIHADVKEVESADGTGWVRAHEVGTEDPTNNPVQEVIFHGTLVIE